MKKIRFFFRLGSTFLLRHKVLIFLSFIIGGLCFLFFPRIGRLLPKVKHTRMIGLIGRYSVNEIPLEVQGLVSMGLTIVGEDGSPFPGLASGWSTEGEGKSYTFTLNDFYWQDKTKITANDINYNFRDVSVEVVDSKTIRFFLKEPFSPFPVIVSRPIFKKGLIGAGNYKIKKITNSGKYHESIILISPDPDRPNLKYRFYPTEESAKIAFKLGEISEIKQVTSQSGFEGWRNVETLPVIRSDQYVGLFFNTSKPFLGEKSFRQALSYALEKEEGAERVYSPISPKSWAYSADVKGYEYDTENAKKLLNKSLEEKSQQVKLKISTVASLLGVAEEVKQSWEKLGIKVEIGAFSSVDEDFDVLLATQEIPVDPDQYSLWHSTQESNISRLKNPRIDKLLEDGRKTLDKQTRKNIYFDFQRYLAEEVPVIFLYHPTVYNISRK